MNAMERRHLKMLHLSRVRGKQERRALNIYTPVQQGDRRIHLAHQSLELQQRMQRDIYVEGVLAS